MGDAASYQIYTNRCVLQYMYIYNIYNNIEKCR